MPKGRTPMCAKSRVRIWAGRISGWNPTEEIGWPAFEGRMSARSGNFTFSPLNHKAVFEHETGIDLQTLFKSREQMFERVEQFRCCREQTCPPHVFGRTPLALEFPQV